MYLKVPQQTHTKIDLFWFDLIETFIYCFISVTQIWYLQVLTLHNIALLQKKHKKTTGKRAKMEYQWKKAAVLGTQLKFNLYFNIRFARILPNVISWPRGVNKDRLPALVGEKPLLSDIKTHQLVEDFNVCMYLHIYNGVICSICWQNFEH